jgi:hypothetical protein
MSFGKGVTEEGLRTIFRGVFLPHIYREGEELGVWVPERRGPDTKFPLEG